MNIEFRPVLTYPENKKPEVFLEKTSKLTSLLVEKYNTWQNTQIINSTSTRLLSTCFAFSGYWFIEGIIKDQPLKTFVFGPCLLITACQLANDMRAVAKKQRIIKKRGITNA